MDSFRLAGRRAQASRLAGPSGFGSALLAEERGGGGGAADWWAETIPEEEAFDGAEPGSVQWEQRRAALAERRVVALEQALEDATSAAEEAGWEREALLVRTAEAEAAAAAAAARADAAAGRAAAELQSAEYVRRLLSRAEQLRDAARSEARQLRARLTARDGELRAALDALDVRDEEAVTLRTRLRGERARAGGRRAPIQKSLGGEGKSKSANTCRWSGSSSCFAAGCKRTRGIWRRSASLIRQPVCHRHVWRQCFCQRARRHPAHNPHSTEPLRCGAHGADGQAQGLQSGRD
jgi:hypothetical protein